MAEKTAKQPGRFSARTGVPLKALPVKPPKRRLATSLPKLGSEALNFCVDQGLMPYLPKLAEEIHHRFKLAVPPRFHLVTDPETDESYLRISASVEGTVKDVADAYDRYVTVWTLAAPQNVAGAVRLSLTVV